MEIKEYIRIKIIIRTNDDNIIDKMYKLLLRFDTEHDKTIERWVGLVSNINMSRWEKMWGLLLNLHWVIV